LPRQQEEEKGKPPRQMAGSEQKVMIKQIGLFCRKSNEDNSPGKHN
jgi:hypothetical protein